MQNTINIGGKKRPFKFGTNATSIFCKEMGITLAQFNGLFSSDKLTKQEINGEEIVLLIYSGLLAGCYSAGLEPDFNRWNVGDWMDEMKPEDLEVIFKQMANNGPKSTQKKTIRKA